MPSSPLVSVIIPTYNRIDFLVQAIDGVLGQTYTNYEVLVADDGSTDGTADRLRQYGSPVQHLRLEHAGRPSATRNRALAVARGDLVAFLDDDDIWLPAKLERQVALLQREQDLGMVYTNACFLDEEGKHSEPVLDRHRLRHGHVFDDLIANCFIHPSTVVMRRGIGERIGWFEESLECIEDYDLWLRVSYDNPVGAVADSLAFIRRHSGQIQHQRELDTWRNMPAVLGGVRDRCKLSIRQHLRLRRALARAHARLAQISPDPSTGRRELLRALWLNPLRRRTWRVLFGFGRLGRHSGSGDRLE
jgi:glycosyltransferase involved in cell wall biosynthesis